MRNGQTEKTGDELGRCIRVRDWAGALAEIDRRFPTAEDAARRAFYHHFRARLQKCCIRDVQRRDRGADIGELAALAFESFRAAIAEDPRDLEHRLALAAFHLRYRRDPAAARPLLAEFAADDHPGGLRDLEFQDHLRLAWRGLASALEGDIDAASDEFAQAYGERFRTAPHTPVKTPIWIMIGRGVRMREDRARELTTLIGRFAGQNPQALERMERRLTGGETKP